MAAPRSVLRLLAALPLAALVQAAVLHESIAEVPAGWSYSATPSGESQVTLQVALTQQNIDQLESKLSSVSTPGSSSYGQYLDLNAVNAQFGPSEASKNAVTSWLQSSGVNSYKVVGDSVWFQTSVSTANSLLGTEFHTYIDTKGVSKVRTTQYSIPNDLAQHIDLVSPTTYFGKSVAQRKTIQSTYAKPLAKRAAGLPASCNSSIVYDNGTYAAITPECLKYIYNVGSYTPDPRSGSHIGFGSFLNESASFSDLFEFEKYFGYPEQKYVLSRTSPPLEIHAKQLS